MGGLIMLSIPAGLIAFFATCFGIAVLLEPGIGQQPPRPGLSGEGEFALLMAASAVVALATMALIVFGGRWMFRRGMQRQK
jgi:hypothetical protein